MRAIERIYLRVLDACAAVAGVVFAAIALLIAVNVALRAGWASGIPGLLDGIEYGLLAATLLGAPWVLARNGHVSVDLAVGAIPEPVRGRVLLVTNLVGAALSAVFVYYAAEATLVSAARGSMVRKTLVFPEWWALAVMPAAMTLMTIEFLRRAIRGGAAARSQVGL